MRRTRRRWAFGRAANEHFRARSEITLIPKGRERLSVFKRLLRVGRPSKVDSLGAIIDQVDKLEK